MDHIGQEHGGGTSYYRVLDVDQAATRMEIREAYLRLKSTYGSGSAALYSLISEAEASEQMAAVEEAYRVLYDEVARREYDQKLGFRRGGARQGAHGESAHAGLVEGTGAERLIFAGEHAAALGENAVRTGTSDPATIQTSRQILPIIKMKANRAGGDEATAKMSTLIATADPGDGDLYKRLRELCEVTEDEMCERTKVSIAYVKAIEANRFDRLPQAVYVKGFLRSYFRYLCVPDAEKLVAAFSARLVDWQANRKA
jgi:hypothetical protein